MPGMQGIDEACTLCGECVKHCPAEALELMGKEQTVFEIMDCIGKDKAFYEDSGGGITISGGEPLMQPEFVIALGKEIKKEGYHLAIETTGYADWTTMKEVFGWFDLILYDIKHMDPKQHEAYTGVSNRLVLDNARRAREAGFPIVYRVPLIGGVNADMDNMEKLAEFAGQTGVREIHLLPYHTYGENKYKLLRKEYLCEAYRPSKAEMGNIQMMLEEKGIHVKIGG